MDKRLAGKVVVITGASSGVGAAIAHDLSRLGAVPVLTARSEDKLRQASVKLSGDFGVYQMDVQKDEQVEEVMQQIMNKYGKIDVLINCAGYGIFEYVKDTSLHCFSDMMEVNYLGTVRCIKAVLPKMLERKSGHIVNIASLAGKMSSAKAAGYSATKHAVLGFSNGLRQELAGTGVYVSTINPGPIDTPFFKIADPSGGYVDHVKWMMLQPEQVSAAVMKALRRRKAEIDLPFAAGVGIKLYQMFPRFLDRVLHKSLNRK